MLRSLIRGLAGAAAFTLSLCALPAAADDGTADVFQKSIVPSANEAIKNVMSQPKPKKQAPTVAQVPPVGQQPLAHPIEMPGDKI